MKILKIVCLLFLTSFVSQAQNEKFIKAMKSEISRLDSVSNVNSYQEIANNLQRIGNAEKTEWLPEYYQGYCYAMLAARGGKENVDKYCDEAEKHLKAANKITPDQSEIFTLRSMVSSLRVMVDPMQRWQIYGAEAADFLKKGKKLNPENPRVYLLEGQSVYFTPEQFGGGLEKATPIFETAKSKFDAFVPATEIHPTWGKSMLDRITSGKMQRN